MEDIVEIILCSMSSIRKPQRVFFQQLFAVMIAFQGKANFRNLARYCNMSEKRFSRWFKRTFDFVQFNHLLFRYTLHDDSEYIAAIDACYMKKTGHNTEGLGWFYNGCAGESQKGLELSAVSIVDIAANTAYSLDARQTIDKEGVSRVESYAKQVVALAPNLLENNIQYLAADAYYSKKKFINPVLESGLNIVGKLRADANLRWLAKTSSNRRPGRPLSYDGKVRFEHELHRFEFVGELEESIHIYTQVVNAPFLGHNIRLVMLLDIRSGRFSKVLLYSTDIDLPATKVVKYYKARFQIEFVFRDAKQYTGLMDCMSLLEDRRHTHINASLTSLNLLKLEDRLDKQTNDETVISIMTWKRRKFNQNILQRVFCHLGLSLKSKEISDVYHKLSDYGAVVA